MLYIHLNAGRNLFLDYAFSVMLKVTFGIYFCCCSFCSSSWLFHQENGKEWELVRHVSFVDCPGHDILMATMLNGAAVMDAALLLIAGNEPCPQPQTSEHLAAVEIMRLQHIIILQNKV